jgi:hypothetical protein
LDDDLELEKAIPTGHRPYGVIFDPKRRWFWVTLFEGGRLQAYDRAGNLHWMQNRRDSPRLALTDDDRLLLTHAMTGQLAIYDLAKLEKGATLPKPKLITLAETHSDTPSDSRACRACWTASPSPRWQRSLAAPRALEFRSPLPVSEHRLPGRLHHRSR